MNRPRMQRSSARSGTGSTPRKKSFEMIRNRSAGMGACLIVKLPGSDMPLSGCFTETVRYTDLVSETGGPLSSGVSTPGQGRCLIRPPAAPGGASSHRGPNYVGPLFLPLAAAGGNAATRPLCTCNDPFHGTAERDLHLVLAHLLVPDLTHDATHGTDEHVHPPRLVRDARVRQVQPCVAGDHVPDHEERRHGQFGIRVGTLCAHLVQDIVQRVLVERDHVVCRHVGGLWYHLVSWSCLGSASAAASAAFSISLSPAMWIMAAAADRGAWCRITLRTTSNAKNMTSAIRRASSTSDGSSMVPWKSFQTFSDTSTIHRSPDIPGASRAAARYARATLSCASSTLVFCSCRTRIASG